MERGEEGEMGRESGKRREGKGREEKIAEERAEEGRGGGEKR